MNVSSEIKKIYQKKKNEKKRLLREMRGYTSSNSNQKKFLNQISISGLDSF